jgi:hypothetical protein
VISLRVDGQVVGKLELYSEWIEVAICNALGDSVLESPELPKRLAESFEEWFDQLPHDVGMALSRQAAFLPVALKTGLFRFWDEDSFAQVLETVKDIPDDDLTDWLCVPVVLQIVGWFARSKDDTQRKVARAILNRWTKARRGPDRKDADEGRDVEILELVSAAENELKEGWEYICRHKSADRRHLRSTLKAMCPPDAVSVLVGRHRTLRGAAQALVARRTDSPVESVAVRTSRGQRRLDPRR